MNASDRVMKLLSITGKLSNLMQRENELLAAHGSKGLKELIEEKTSLGNAYEQHVRVLREEEAMSEVDPSLRKRLSETLTAFGTVLQENKARIDGNLQAGRKLFEIIAQAARDHQPSTGIYGSSGSRQENPNRGYAPALSVGVNQEL